MSAVLRTAFGSLVRHWPVLFALVFAGLGARALLQWAAIKVAGFDPTAGLLVFILVPITTMAAMVLMLRAVRRTLPYLATVPDAPGGARRLLDAVGSVLLPFLAVYASYGYLQSDRSEYYYGTWLADPTGPLRVPTRLGVTLVAAIAVAVAGRWWLGRSAWAKRHGWTGFAGAYLEIVWIGVAASIVAPLQSTVWSWITSRRAVSWGVDASHALTPVRGVFDWLGSLTGVADTVIAVPVAWLAVGAVVYGRQVASTDPGRLARRAARRWVRLPVFVRRVAEPGKDAVAERFGPLLDGLRLLTRVGLASMLLFCLLFLLAQNADVWMFELERLLIGPQDLFRVWMPASGVLAVVNDAVRTVLLVCLLGSAVDRMLAVTAARRAEPAEATEPPAGPVVVTGGDPEADWFAPPAGADGSAVVGSPRPAVVRPRDGAADDWFAPPAGLPPTVRAGGGPVAGPPVGPPAGSPAAVDWFAPSDRVPEAGPAVPRPPGPPRPPDAATTDGIPVSGW